MKIDKEFYNTEQEYAVSMLQWYSLFVQDIDLFPGNWHFLQITKYLTLGE